MPKTENAGNQRDNANKPNKGQDENTHTFVGPDGTQQENTMRWFRNEGRDAGFTKLEDADEPVVEDETAEASA
jgi:hypothetical protein